MSNRILVFTIAVMLSAVAGSVCADENVQAVQEKLRDGGFYTGEIDGAYSTELSAALTRYQIRNGLPISGQLDVETSEALGAKPAVGPSTADTEQSSETWRRLRKGERRTSSGAQRAQTAATEGRDTSSPTPDEAAGGSTETRPHAARAATDLKHTSSPHSDEAAATSMETRSRSAPETTPQPSAEATQPASAPQASESGAGISTERLHDYVAAFVLAGLDRKVGAEAEFFADRVEYYDSGVIDREKIREDLKRYDEKWPERHFWLAGKISIEPQSDNRVRVTFPLGFKLRNGNKQSSGKVDKTLVLEPAGDDFAIVAVNEVSESKK